MKRYLYICLTKSFVTKCDQADTVFRYCVLLLIELSVELRAKVIVKMCKTCF